jgi:hypothetical protein
MSPRRKCRKENFNAKTQGRGDAGNTKKENGILPFPLSAGINPVGDKTVQ